MAANNHRSANSMLMEIIHLLGISYNGEVLDLHRVSRSHMGAYLCIASNGVPPSLSKRIMLSVQCKYIFQLFSQHNVYRLAFFVTCRVYLLNICSSRVIMF